MKSKYKGLTPHNDAQKGEIAKTVLMPGDPLRAKFIANTYLENVKQVNNVRAMAAYTGTYKGKEVTIMGSGMGIPSMGIYSSELFEFYGVENIMRIGSTGALKAEIKLFDIIVGEDVVTESTYYEAVMDQKSPERLKGNAFLIEKVKEEAVKLNLNDKLFRGTINSSDAFYRTEKAAKKYHQKLAKANVLGIEMESTALYTNAERFNKRALTLLSVSDHLVTGEVTTSQERQESFKNMMELALNVAITL